MITEEQLKSLSSLAESSVITTEDKNLRSKMESLIRSLEGLEQKRQRIDYEIRKQKKSLLRKREEFKRISKRNQAKYSESLNSHSIFLESYASEPNWFSKLDARLLRESDQLLERNL